MTSSQVQRTGLPRTVLFVDVCGSTKLYETLGNARAQAVIAKRSLGEPTPLRTLRPSVPVHVERAVRRALSFLASDRFG